MAGVARPQQLEAPRFFSAAGLLLARSSSILLLLIGWELFARSGAVTMFVLPPLSAVLERIWADAFGELWLNMGLTLYRALTGFLISAVAGVALGLLISRNAVARW